MTVYLSNRDGNGKTNEEGHYRLQTRILKGGVLLADDLKVVQTSPLSMGIQVSTGDYRLETAAGYSYTGWLDDEEVVSIDTADPANPRITSLVLYIDKSETTAAVPPNNPDIAKLMAVNGTAAGSPSAPSGAAIQSAVGAGNPYMVLAQIAVAAGATQVTNANIEDLRTRIGIIDEVLAGSDISTVIGSIMYPVGSIYTNADVATNPATLLGFGTWAQYGSGRVLVGQNSGDPEFDTLGETGGAKTHTLTLAQIPNATGAISAHSSRSAWWQPSGVFSTSNQTNVYSATCCNKELSAQPCCTNK